MENRSLVLDLVEWIGREPRSYQAVMDAWRTSCPRLSIWEDAVERGFVVRELKEGVPIVRVTRSGEDFLKSANRIPAD